MALKGILGKKLGMTSLFDESGVRIPVTVVEAGPCVVVQRKTADENGYDAVQLGYGDVKPPKTRTDQGGTPIKRGRSHNRGRNVISQPMAGHFAKYGATPKRYLQEFRISPDEDLSPGSEVTVEVFEPGDRIKVTGTSKGRGFAGAMRRHGFAGHGASHGQKIHRTPASAGATDAARVIKGKRGPGHMGNRRVTVTGLQVVRVDKERNLLLVKGAVPGAVGSLLRIEAY